MSLSGAPVRLGFRLRILLSSCGITRRIASLSQSVLSGRRRWATIRSCWFSGAGPMGRSCSVLLSQESVHTWIDSPFPTAHLALLQMRSRPTKSPFQPWDSTDLCDAVRNVSSAKYFPFNTLLRRQWGLLISLQLNVKFQSGFIQSNYTFLFRVVYICFIQYSFKGFHIIFLFINYKNRKWKLKIKRTNKSHS